MRSLIAAAFLFSLFMNGGGASVAIASPFNPAESVIQEKRLTQEEVETLLGELADGLSELVDDEDQVSAITEKWEGHEDLAGKTRRQILAVLFADVRSVVQEKETQDAIWASWNKPAGAQPAPAPPKPADPEPEPPKPVVQPGLDLGQYIRGLNYNAASLLAVRATGNQPVYEKVLGRNEMRKPGSGKITKCSLSTRSLSRNFTDIAILQPTRGVIYPGSLVFADRGLIDGGPRALPGLARGSLNLRVDLPGAEDDGSFTVETPNEGNVRNALNGVLNAWNGSSGYKEGYLDEEKSSKNSAAAYSSAQLAIALGFNEDWAQGPISAEFKSVSTSEKSVAMVAVKQVFYTVSVDAPENPAEFFGEGVTGEQARGVFSSENVPAYISSVSYGRIMLFRLENERPVGTVDAEAALKYAAGIDEADGAEKAKYDAILGGSRITAITIGANATATPAAVRGADIARMLKASPAVYTRNNPGVPVSYTVNFLKDNAAARTGASTDYGAEECKDFPNTWIEIRQNGAYMADYTVTWDEPGAPGKKEEGRYSSGNKMQVSFSGDATNIRIHLRTMSDVLIVNKVLQPQELNKCYQTYGVATGPGWNNDCQ